MSKKNQQARAERAAALMREQKRRERRRQIITIAGVVTTMVLLVAGGFLIQSLRDDAGQPLTEGGTPSGTTDTYAVVVGEADAPTTITIYEDFQCPVCGVFEEAVGERLHAAIEAGEVKVEYRMVSFLDRASTNEYSSRALNAAAVVLDASGIDPFVAFHALLFENQPEEGGPGLSDDELISLAVEAGADEDAIRQGIEDKVFEQWVLNTQDEMSKNDVNGTPTVFINGESAGTALQDSIDATLDALG
ncbi:DsbA family protein [Nocardioides sp.]|uniref:DsbA family protein n=1 Tax=Nocardioides sp. TaxID=35761 RepID=UPI003566C2A7